MHVHLSTFSANVSKKVFSHPTFFNLLCYTCYLRLNWLFDVSSERKVHLLYYNIRSDTVSTFILIERSKWAKWAISDKATKYNFVINNAMLNGKNKDIEFRTSFSWKSLIKWRAHISPKLKYLECYSDLLNLDGSCFSEFCAAVNFRYLLGELHTLIATFSLKNII